MSADNKDLERNEDCRWAVLGFLVGRASTANDANRIKQRLAIAGENWSLDEVKGACEFWLSREYVTVHQSEAGVTKFYQPTAEGILAWERRTAV